MDSSFSEVAEVVDVFVSFPASYGLTATPCGMLSSCFFVATWVLWAILEGLEAAGIRLLGILDAFEA